MEEARGESGKEDSQPIAFHSSCPDLTTKKDAGNQKVSFERTDSNKKFLSFLK
jgi:hypothetical protein